MIRTAIVEDDSLYREELQELLARYSREKGETFRVTPFTDGEQIAREYAPEFDLILMDIEMGAMNGMEAAKKIRGADEEVTIIFITNMPQYAIEGYRVGALDYILKPVSYPAFEGSLARAISHMKKQEEHYLIIHMKNGSRKLPLSRVLYIDVMDHDLCYHTLDGEFMTKASMRSVLQTLEGEPFFQCSKGYVVNLAHVEGFQDTDLLVGGERVQVSRARRKPLLDALNDYLDSVGK